MGTLRGGLRRARGGAAGACLSGMRGFRCRGRQLTGTRVVRGFICGPGNDGPRCGTLGRTRIVGVSTRVVLRGGVLRQVVTRQCPVLLVSRDRSAGGRLVSAFFRVREGFTSVFALNLLKSRGRQVCTSKGRGVRSSVPVK